MEDKDAEKLNEARKSILKLALLGMIVPLIVVVIAYFLFLY
jgi:hypothetical protein